MTTTLEYLNQLQSDKESLANNLISKGIEASSSETFTALVPKVLNIQSGGSSNIKTKTGTFVLDEAVSEYSLNLGFQPKIIIVNIQETEQASGLYTTGWAKTIQTLDFTLIRNMVSGAFTFKNEENTELIENGIKLKRYSSYNISKGTYSYEAYG